jgi:hypothetical protein
VVIIGEIEMKTPEEIIDIVQEELDESEEGIDLLDYIYLCEELTEEEKEWASGSLGVSIKITLIWE